MPRLTWTFHTMSTYRSHSVWTQLWTGKVTQDWMIHWIWQSTTSSTELRDYPGTHTRHTARTIRWHWLAVVYESKLHQHASVHFNQDVIRSHLGRVFLILRYLIAEESFFLSLKKEGEGWQDERLETSDWECCIMIGGCCRSLCRNTIMCQRSLHCKRNGLCRYLHAVLLL